MLGLTDCCFVTVSELHAASMAVNASLIQTRGSGLYSALKGKVFKMGCSLGGFLRAHHEHITD